MDNFEAIIIGAAAAAIGTVIAYRYINLHPVGGFTPRQPNLYSFGARSQTLSVVDLPPTPSGASPVQQTNPNQEAAFNQYPTSYAPAFGPSTDQSMREEVFPI